MTYRLPNSRKSNFATELSCFQGAPQRMKIECTRQPVNPLVGFALAHAKYASLHDLEDRGFEVDEDEEQPIFRGREGAVLVHGEPACGPRLPIEAPRGHMRLERRLQRGDQLLKHVERQARQIQEFCGRDCTSVHRTLVIRGASFHRRHSLL